MPSSLQRALTASSTTTPGRASANSSWTEVEEEDDQGVESISSNEEIIAGGGNNSKMPADEENKPSEEEVTAEEPLPEKEENGGEEDKKEEEDKKDEEETKEDEGDDDKKEEDKGEEDKKKEGEEEDEKPAKFVFEGRNPRLIQAKVAMISGCLDQQCSMDVGASTTEKFNLHDPAGLSSGALTTVILDTLGEETKKKDIKDKLSGLAFMQSIRSKLKDNAEVSQVPQYSASSKVDMDQPFEFVPAEVTGTKRAVIIGINYVNCPKGGGQLSGCHNDAINMKNFLVENHGFLEDNIVMLMDDGTSLKPTKWNILSELNKMVDAAEAGDYCFMHYSGHGCYVHDESGDEKDGFDEALCPASGGLIVDDELFENVVTQLKKDVTMFAVIDACHSGTVLDLPYRYAFKDDAEASNERDEEEEGEEGEGEANADDEDDDEDDEDKSELDDQMMAMTAMLLMMQVNRKMGKKKAKKLKEKMNQMMEFFG